MTIYFPTWCRSWAKPPEEVTPRDMVRIPRQSGKESADDIPSWARGKPRRVGETPVQFAKRLMDEKYGRGGWDDRIKEFNRLRKWGSRAFRDPRSILPGADGDAPQA